MIQLSDRLQRIADLVPPGSVLADIGTDHALLPVYLVQRRRIPRAIAGDVNPGPYEAAREQARSAGTQESVDVRLGDGLSVLKPGEADCVAIAGMGGSTICAILNAGPEVLAKVRRLILAPNIAEDAVRRWLFRARWRLIEEKVVAEDGRVYVVLCAEPLAYGMNPEMAWAPPAWAGCGVSLNLEDSFQFGPCLLRDGDLAFERKWRLELDKLGRISAGLAKSVSEDGLRRRQEVARHIRHIEEVLACWRNAKPSCN